MPRKRILPVHYCKSKCRNLVATKAEGDKCTLQQKIFQWSQAWTFQELKQEIVCLYAWEKEETRMLTTCKAVKKKEHRNLLNHTVHGTSSSPATHTGLNCVKVGSVFIEECQCARNCQQTLRRSLSLTGLQKMNNYILRQIGNARVLCYAVILSYWWCQDTFHDDENIRCWKGDGSVSA